MPARRAEFRVCAVGKVTRVCRAGELRRAGSVAASALEQGMGAALQRRGFGQPGHGLSGVGVHDGQTQCVGCIGAGQTAQVEQAAR